MLEFINNNSTPLMILIGIINGLLIRSYTRKKQ